MLPPWHPPGEWWLWNGEPICDVTFPGHERNLGELVDAVAWELEKAMLADFSRGVVGADFSDVLRPAALRSVLETYRRHGIPAVSADLDDEGRCITVQIARPAGFG